MSSRKRTHLVSTINEKCMKVRNEWFGPKAMSRVSNLILACRLKPPGKPDRHAEAPPRR